MKTFVPDYYKAFRCIAGKCRHSCCIGWEIDIDEDTCELYHSIGGGFGKRLRENIEGDPPHFRLKADERCPFLTSDGLCDIILTLGEGALCQICDDHPRYRNFYSDRVEMGLGLCCEGAAKLILEGQEPSRMILLDDDGETEPPLTEEETVFFQRREELLNVVRDRSLSMDERMEKLFSASPSPEELRLRWLTAIREMECLDPARDAVLTDAMREQLPPLPPSCQIPTEHLLTYFINRHLPGALDDGRWKERVAFAVFSCLVIRWMWAGVLSVKGELSPEDLIECARLYSSEYEYSDENTEAILNLLTTES